MGGTSSKYRTEQSDPSVPSYPSVSIHRVSSIESENWSFESESSSFESEISSFDSESSSFQSENSS